MALNGSLAAATPGGALRTATGPPVSFNAGTPLLADGYVATTDIAQASYYAGLSYDAAGRLAIAVGGTPAFWVAGVPVDASGRVVGEVGDAAFYAPNAVPITAGGRVAMQSQGAPAFTPAQLFAAGEPGGWWDPSDISTLFQDSAGTVPVTASGQPVGRINDKSGRGNHLVQVTSFSRPFYVVAGALRYLEFDGANHWMVSVANLNMSTTDALTAWIGVTKMADKTFHQMQFELSANLGNNVGSFYLNHPDANAPFYEFLSRGNVTNFNVTVATAAVGMSTNVITGQADISSDINIARSNGVQTASNTFDQGGGNYGSYPFWVGCRGGTQFLAEMRLYGLIIRGAASSAGDVTAAEQWMAGKAGIAF
jgi:hypothetical protein